MSQSQTLNITSIHTEYIVKDYTQLHHKITSSYKYIIQGYIKCNYNKYITVSSTPILSILYRRNLSGGRLVLRRGYIRVGGPMDSCSESLDGDCICPLVLGKST